MSKHTCKQVGRLLGVSERRIRQLIDEGRLKAEKFGKSWMIEGHDLTELKERRENGSK